jgi:hypothetical protein
MGIATLLVAIALGPKLLNATTTLGAPAGSPAGD